MTSRIALTLLVLCVGIGPDRAWAYDCSRGGEGVTITSRFELMNNDPGDTIRFVYLVPRTGRTLQDYENCPGWARVEGWITGDPAGAMTDQARGSASLAWRGRVDVLVALPGTVLDL